MTRRIGRFQSKPGIVCAGFWRLPYIAACPHQCAYCYLAGTYWRGLPRDLTEADLPEMQHEVERWMERTRCEVCDGSGEWCRACDAPSHGPVQDDATGGPCPVCKGTGGAILNAGELSDSFAPAISAELSLRLIEMFRAQDRHTLLLLTKALPHRVLRKTEPTPQVILSFSLGQQRFCGQPLAGRGPTGEALIAAAGELRAMGWRVRLRIDPIIDRQGPEQIERLLEKTPGPWERITLGSLRFTEATHRLMVLGTPLQHALAGHLVARMEPDFGHHPWRLGTHERVRLYRDIRERLAGCTDSWALCKETPDIWRLTFGADWPGHESVRCNCTP